MISPNDSSVVLYMPFSEGSGSTALDYSGNGNNGVITGATYSKVKDGDYALSFNGSSDYISITASTGNITYNSFTIIVWIKTSSATYQKIYSRNTSSNAGVFLMLYSSGKLAALVKDDAGNQINTNGGGSETPLYDGNWHQIAFTYDETTSTVTQFVDGVVTETATNTAVGIPSQVQTTATFGRQAYTGAEYFNGKIRFPMIFNKALTKNEITKIYQDTYIE